MNELAQHLNSIKDLQINLHQNKHNSLPNGGRGTIARSIEIVPQGRRGAYSIALAKELLKTRGLQVEERDGNLVLGLSSYADLTPNDKGHKLYEALKASGATEKRTKSGV